MKPGETITGYGTSYSYDVMGNVLSLSRYGDISAGTKGPVDNLTMTYDGNRLVSVQDAAQAVTMSGSRAKQRLSAREGLSEQHSRAKQRLFAREGPSEQHSRAKQGLFAREGLSERQSSLSESWRYLPDGTKLSRTISDGDGPASVTDYRGNLVYKDGVLKDILTDGGLIDMTEASPRYVFFLKDHLGSVRVAAMLNGMKVQTNLYYPYGMSYASSALAGSGSSTVEDGGDIQVFPGGSIPEIPGTPEIAEEYISTIPYRFCGKEQNLADGLGMYDFLARRYDPVLCRFTSPDPLAEKYPSVSPYAYCGNDPVNKVDPDGRIWETAWDIANVVMDVKSLASNIKERKTFDAVLDGAGLVADVAAVILPIVPGGAGTAIKAVRVGDKTSDATKTIEKVANIEKNTDNVDVISGLTNKAHGPIPNDGVGPQHGGKFHNDNLDQAIVEHRASGTDLRKNQAQVDVHGNKVGSNRPDLQYNKGGVHYNEEFDYTEKSSQKHQSIIMSNDPNSVFIGNILKR